jgi:hypothetical protein
MSKKWKDVSDHLAQRLQKKKYTGKACRERYNALHDGTALRPIEIDSDQEGRKVMRETRIAAAKQRRTEAAAEAHRVEIEKQAKIARKRAEDLAQEAAKQLQKKLKEDGKLLEEQIKKKVATEKAQARADRHQVITQAADQARWDKVRRKAEAELFKQISGGMMLPTWRRMMGEEFEPSTTRNRPRSTKAPGWADDADDEDEDHFESLNDDKEDMESEADYYDDDESSLLLNVVEPAPPDYSLPQAVMVAPAVVETLADVPVTTTTLRSPRSVMTLEELDAVLHERGLPRRSAAESHPMVVARICAADDKLTSQELTDLLMRHFDKGYGIRAAKARRLAEWDAKDSAAGIRGVKSTDQAFVKDYEGYKAVGQA